MNVDGKIALISVYDKSNLEELVEALTRHGYTIISSSGTARKIRELGFKVIELTDYTGYPESPGGLVKTLHPKIHGGLLLNPQIPSHKIYMDKLNIKPIDILVVNLYPFEHAVMGGKLSLREAAEYIDIGGPALIRAAAKGALLNGRPAVVTEPAQYPLIIRELKLNNGLISKDLILKLAFTAFKKSMLYDHVIVKFLGEIYGLEEA
ncbi:MAG: hypothetical protein J7J22_05160 [Candidatus Verstraetearchaeota archaeon]|nr:hypothetical protein [Candidatus Verstraetearchaeota archaeon]